MMRNALHPIHLHQVRSIDHALGDLLRFLSTVEPIDDSSGGIPAGRFLDWFEDRFHIPNCACTSKAFGDAITFGIRLGLIHFGKKPRTRQKLIHYTGTSLSRLDEALRQWKGTNVLINATGSIQSAQMAPNFGTFRDARSSSPVPSGGTKVGKPEPRYPLHIDSQAAKASDGTGFDDEDEVIDF